MSEKRRDSKNRILRNGESQRKDGRYAFKYIDSTGKQQFIAGNWNGQTSCHKGKEMTFLLGKKKR